MSQVKITIICTKDRLRDTSVAKLLDEIKAEYPGINISVAKYERPESRADRLAEAESKCGEA